MNVPETLLFAIFAMVVVFTFWRSDYWGSLHGFLHKYLVESNNVAVMTIYTMAIALIVCLLIVHASAGLVAALLLIYFIRNRRKYLIERTETG